MKIKVKTPEVNFFMPVPLGLAGAAIRAMPEAAFESMRKKVDSPYASLICKEVFVMYWEACKEELKSCKGLEIVHVEAQDGTFVSIVV